MTSGTRTTIGASDPIELLTEEHRLIERVLDALDRWSARAEAGDAAAQAQLGGFVEFIRGFADQQHHGKEEDILFVAMGEAGFPTDGGPIAVMLEEHGLGRQLVQELAEGAAQPVWDDRLIAGVTRAARSYGGLLRQHIQKEDRILYPMARQVLGPGLEEVGQRCAEFAADAARERQERELRALADRLIAQ